MLVNILFTINILFIIPLFHNDVSFISGFITYLVKLKKNHNPYKIFYCYIKYYYHSKINSMIFIW